MNVREIQQKTYRDTQQDGFVELFAGMFFWLYGGISYHVLAGMRIGFPYVPLVFFFVFPAAVLEIVRRKVTYPRIGRAKIKEEIRPLYFVAVGLPLALFPILMFVLRLFSDAQTVDLLVTWSPALMGVVLAGLAWDRAIKTGNARYYGIALLSVVSGFLLSMVEFSPQSTGILLLFVMTGGAYFLCGAVMLIQFVRTHPVVEGGLNDQKGE